MNIASRCATACGCSRRSMFPRINRSSIRSCSSRTPYSVEPYGTDEYKADLGPSPSFGKDGYIVVYQDVRGCWMSEGEFVNMRPHRPQKSSPQEIDESSDTFDTIEWLIKNVPGHNGRVGMWGISYPGLLHGRRHDRRPPRAQGGISPGPGHRLVRRRRLASQRRVPLAARLQFHGRLSGIHARSRPRHLDERFDPGTPDGYDFFLRLGPLSNVNTRYFKDDVPFWNEIMQHGTYDDFWKARNLRPHLKNIKPAVMTVGGWFDAENLFGALETYKNVEANSQGTTNILVMGPWRHGGWSRDDGEKLGPVPFFSKTSEFYREHIEFPFFQYYLKGKGSPSFPEAWVFETGTNEWKKYDHWPPRNPQAPLALFSGERRAFIRAAARHQ